MNLRERRIKFLQDVITNGKTKTWVEYADEFNLANSKQASDFYRYYQRTGNIVPDLIQEETEETKSTDTVDYSIPEGAIVTGGWVKNSKQSIRFTIPQQETKALEDNLVETLKEYSPKVIKLKKKTIGSKTCLVLSIPDLHFSKGPIQDTVDNFYTAITDIIQRTNIDSLEKIIFPIGNDLLNSDGHTRGTTKGTPQFDSEDWNLTFDAALKVMVDTINWLSTICPVEVINVRGNHANTTEFYLARAIEGYMHNNENVTINNSIESRKYSQYGVTGFMFEHGELKSNEYPLLFATEEPQLWAATKYREALLGHLHQQRTTEIKGFLNRILPSLCPADMWHKNKGYVGNIRSAQAFIYDKERGFMQMLEYRMD